jgi:hypothetical protein
LESSGAPDMSGAPDQRCLRLSLCSFVEPNTWSFYWLSVNLVSLILTFWTTLAPQVLFLQIFL